MTSPSHTTPQDSVAPIYHSSTSDSIPPGLKPRIVLGDEVTDEQLVACATLFSENYGVWGAKAPKPLKPGARVKMSPAKLRAECLGDPKNSILHMMYKDGKLVGQAFATKWSSETETVGWVTQLVVDANERRKRIATNLLRGLTASPWFAGITMMGIASTHPAACNALCNMLDQDIGRINLSDIQESTPKALQSSTVKYLRQAQLHGSVFEEADDGSISLADTSFYVDHSEPEEVLSSYIENKRWCLGALREGHEYLLLLSVTSPGATSSTHTV